MISNIFNQSGIHSYFYVKEEPLYKTFADFVFQGNKIKRAITTLKVN